MPGLFLAGLSFFAVNCWILGIMVGDIGERSSLVERNVGKGDDISRHAARSREKPIKPDVSDARP